MQEYADSIVNSVGILVAAISTLLVVLAPLVGLFTSALISSGIVAADSKFAIFVAKLFPMSVHATSVKRAKRAPKVPPVVTLLFVGLLGFGHAGCNRATIDAQIDKALLLEDQVLAQVNYLDAVFQSLVENPTMNDADKAMFRRRFADSKAILMQAMTAKDSALRAAKAANAEVINLPELVAGIVDAVQEIIQVVAMVGATPLLVQEQQTRAMGLTRGM